MLDEATPRAQLHVQRILGRIGEGTNGGVSSPRIPKRTQGIASNHTLSKSCTNFVVAQTTGSSYHRTDTRGRPTTAGSVTQSSPSNDRFAASARMGKVVSPRNNMLNSSCVKTPRVLFDSLDSSQEGNLPLRIPSSGTGSRSNNQRMRRTNAVSSAMSVVQQDQSCKIVDVDDAAVSANTSGSTIDLGCLLLQMEADESFYRRLLEELHSIHMEGLQQARCSGEVLVGLLKDTVAAVTRVSHFLRTPVDEVLQDPKSHLARIGDIAPQSSDMDVKDMFSYVERMPSAITANYMRLIALNQSVTEEEELTPTLAIPQPHPPQQQQQQQTTTSDEASLYVCQPSSLFSCCGSVPPPVSLSCQQHSGSTSPHMALLLSGTIDSVEDLPSSSTIIFRTNMCRVERDADAALVVEDLREETAYWQEEALRAMFEAEQCLQMVYTVLGWPSSNPPNGSNESGSRKMSVTSLGSTAQRCAVHRAFLQLLNEMEEGERGKIESQEAQEWWQCCVVAADYRQAFSTFTG